MNEVSPNVGSVRLYHRSGALVTLPVTGADPAAMHAHVDAFLAAGFAVAMPGLEAGEEKDMVGWLVRGQAEGQRGDVTDFLLLYSTNDAYTFSFLKVYLNKPEDVAAFEAAAGMRLTDLPVYVGRDKPERGKSKAVDSQFIRAVRKPFGVVFKQNPKWSQEAADSAKNRNEMYTVPRRVFVRWDGQGEAKAADPRTEPQGAIDPDAIRAKWKNFMASSPPVEVFNRFCKDNWPDVPKNMQGGVNKAIQEHADKNRWTWDGQAGEYYAAKTVGGYVDDQEVPF